MIPLQKFIGSIVTINSAVPTAEVYDKNETSPVDPTKVIVSVDGTAQSDVAAADAHVGSVVGFKLTGSTNNWIDKDHIRESWTITDTPTNMTIDLSSVVVKFNGTALTAGTDYTATLDATTGALTIYVPMVDSNGNSVFPANLGTSAGLIPIEITYSATITAEAAAAPAKNQIPGSSTEVDTYVPLFPPIQMCAPVIGSGCALILSAGAGRCPVVFLKAAGESVLIVKTEQRCNKRYRHIGFRKHLPGLFQFQCCQKLLGGTLIFIVEAA